jgi:hypothetical protein
MMKLLLARMNASMKEHMQEMTARMDTNKAEMKADRKAYHKEMMGMLDAHYERMLACLGKTEADTEKTEPDPSMMQSIEEHQENPKKEP